MRIVRVFVSSPGDSENERKRVVRVMERLNAAFAGTVRFQPVLWEERFYSAHDGFQQQIERSTDCDIVVAILRGRLGTPLPPDFMARLPEGEQLSDPVAYQSGTAYEILSAIAARRRGAKLPDIFVFRYPHNPVVGLDDENRADIEAQWQKLKSFAEQVFVSEEGHFRGAYQTFSSTDDFETQAEGALRQWLSENVLRDRAVVWPIAIKGSPFRGLEPFGAKHAEVFYGRDGDRGRALDRLKDAADAGFPFLAIIGPSGAGKSSFARAGILPWLVKPGAVTGIGVWRTAAMRPSDHPNGAIASLARHLFDDEKDIAEPETGRPIALPELASGDSATPQALAGLFSVFARGKFEQAEDLENAGRAALAPIERALKSVAEAESKAWGSEKEAPARLLLVIDQLDELFAPDVDDAARAAFARLIERMASSGLVWIVATLRAEFYEAFLKSQLARLASPEVVDTTRRLELTFDLLPPGLTEMAEIVRGPARAAGLDWEIDPASKERLDDRLLTDIDRPDLLPLVQFVLEQLYEQRDQKDGAVALTFDAYRALGRLDGAIDKAAEKALSQLGPAEQAALPRLLRGLVTYARRAPGSGNSAVALVQAQRKVAAHDAASTRLVDALTEARILVSGNDQDKAPIVALAHQRVIEAWQNARRIVAENENLLRVREEVEDARLRWMESGQRRDRLIPPGLPLSEAENAMGMLNDEFRPETRAYIKKSGRAARVRQTLLGTAAIIFLMVAGVAAFAYHRAGQAAIEAEFQRDSANRATIEAKGAATEAEFQRRAAESASLEAKDRQIQALRNQSSAMAALSKDVLASNQTLATKFALAAWPRTASDPMPQNEEALTALSEAVSQLRERQVYRGHYGAVLDAVFSSDGSKIISWAASDFMESGEIGVLPDKTARVWDVASGQVKAILRGHEGQIVAAAFSPDGSRVLTAAKDHTVRVWEIATGRVIDVMQIDDGKDTDDTFFYVSFSQDGKFVFTRSGFAVQIWNVERHNRVAIFQHQNAKYRQLGPHLSEGSVYHYSLSSNGERIVTTAQDSTVRVWNAKTGDLIVILRGDKDDYFYQVSFLPDDTRVLARSSKSVQIWDAASGKRLQTLHHESGVNHVSFSKDGTRIAAALADGSVKVWDAKSGKLSFTLGGHGDAFDSVSFSPYGTRILAQSDNSVELWDASTGDTISSLGHEGTVRNAYFVHNGTGIITVSNDKYLRLWDSVSGVLVAVFRAHDDVILQARMSPDETHVITTSKDKTMRLWDVSIGTTTAIMRESDQSNSATFSPSVSRAVVSSSGKTAQIWNTYSDEEIVVLSGHEDSVLSARFSPDGTRIVTASADKSARIWDARKGTQISQLNGHVAEIWMANFSPDGLKVVTASGDLTARIWDLATGQTIATLQGHENQIFAAKYSPDGTKILTASGDKTARIWDAKTGAMIMILHGKGAMLDASFSPDGSLITTSSSDKTAQVWRVDNGKMIAVLRGHEGDVTSVSFSPSGDRVISASADGTARIWDVSTHSTLAVLRGHVLQGDRQGLTSASFSSDGSLIVTSSRDRTTRIWDAQKIPKGSLFTVACDWLPNHDLADVEKEFSFAKLGAICNKDQPLPSERMYSNVERDERLRKFDDAIAASPEDAYLFFLRGDVESSIGDFDGAVADYSQAIKLDPKDSKALNARCFAAVLADKVTQQTLSDCDESLRLSPKDEYTLDSRGFSNLRLRRFDEAISDFDAAISIRHDFASSLYGRGIARLAVGNKAAGDNDINLAKTLDPRTVDTLIGVGIE